MTGKIVKEVPPPHSCLKGRPSEFNYNLGLGTVWQCECGKFYKITTDLVYDWINDYDYNQRVWVEVKDSDGTEWVIQTIPRARYITKVGVWPFHDECSEHGRVPRGHVHKERV